MKRNIMNLDADITWIQNEIAKIKDPDLINLFKSLLKYRDKKTAEDALDLLLISAFKDKAEGRTKTHTEIRRKYGKWL
jgi:hypothetical protein